MNDEIKDLKDRINELNAKASQILLFLSFAIVAGVTLKDHESGQTRPLLLSALRLWTGAIFPVIFCVLPLKDLWKDSLPWYRFLRWLKVILLALAILFIIIGAWKFFGRSKFAARCA